MVIIKKYKAKKTLFNKFPEISGKIGINFRKFPEIFWGKFPEISELTTLDYYYYYYLHFVRQLSN